jgi:RimJ/RimL family protein N-acetyltransferase
VVSEGARHPTSPLETSEADLTNASDAESYAAAILVGRRTRLRALEEPDLPVLDRWWQHVDTATMRRDVVVPQPAGSAFEQFRPWSANDPANPDAGFSVVDLADGQLVGRVTLWGATWRTRAAELGVIIGDEHRGRGMGSDAIRVLLRLAFADLGLHRVELRTPAYNDPALAAYRRVGFSEEGRRREVAWHAGRWHDEVLMSVLEREWAEQDA